MDHLIATLTEKKLPVPIFTSIKKVMELNGQSPFHYIDEFPDVEDLWKTLQDFMVYCNITAQRYKMGSKNGRDKSVPNPRSDWKPPYLDANDYSDLARQNGTTLTRRLI